MVSYFRIFFLLYMDHLHTIDIVFLVYFKHLFCFETVQTFLFLQFNFFHGRYPDKGKCEGENLQTEVIMKSTVLLSL